MFINGGKMGLMEENGAKWSQMAGSGVRAFRGTFTHRLNKQGRISLPSRFKEVLDARKVARIVIVRHRIKLDAFPEDEWQNEELRRESLDMDDEKISDYMHYLHSNVFEVDIDGQGRILIPPALREGLGGEGKEVVMLGMSKYFEIWPQEGYQDEYRHWEEKYPDTRAHVADLKRQRSG
jgi:MraZ protein